MHKLFTQERGFTVKRLLPALLLVACHVDAPSVEAVCAPEREFPYADGSPYTGVHGDPANSDVVACDISDAFERGWHALQGLGITQPNTFSPDGLTTYVTSTNSDPAGCRLHALDVASGRVIWCRSFPPSVTEGAVEVDEDGNLFLTYEGRVASLEPSGAGRWSVDLGTEEAPWGIHFSVEGHVVTVTPDGQVFLIARDDGAILSALSIREQWGFVEAENVELLLDPALIFPPPVFADLEAVFGPTDGSEADSGASSFLGAGSFVDNTVGIAADGTLYVIGGGPDPDTGALVQIRVEDGALIPGWYAPTLKGSATTPSISADGRWVVVGDGASMDRFLSSEPAEAYIRVADIVACDANTDTDPDPGVCAFAVSHPMQRGPMMGAPAILPDGTTLFYELGLDFAAAAADRDVIALGSDGAVQWEVALPDDLEWTSVITVTNDHLVGTATAVKLSGESFLQLAFPRTAQSVLIVLDRHSGETVFTSPIPDDASATVTVGPAGELYVGMLGMVSLLAIEVRPTLGLLRFNPI